VLLLLLLVVVWRLVRCWMWRLLLLLPLLLEALCGRGCLWQRGRSPAQVSTIRGRSALMAPADIQNFGQHELGCQERAHAEVRRSPINSRLLVADTVVRAVALLPLLCR
jgi:hypothetical protein